MFLYHTISVVECCPTLVAEQFRARSRRGVYWQVLAVPSGLLLGFRIRPACRIALRLVEEQRTGPVYSTTAAIGQRKSQDARCTKLALLDVFCRSRNTRQLGRTRELCLLGNSCLTASQTCTVLSVDILPGRRSLDATLLQTLLLWND